MNFRKKKFENVCDFFLTNVRIKFYYLSKMTLQVIDVILGILLISNQFMSLSFYVPILIDSTVLIFMIPLMRTYFVHVLYKSIS